jgi:hypothetical protein
VEASAPADALVASGSGSGTPVGGAAGASGDDDGGFGSDGAATWGGDADASAVAAPEALVEDARIDMPR